MTNATKLLEERAQLLARIEELDHALKLLDSPTQPVEIMTRRNLRNTDWLNVQVYEDIEMTIVAKSSAFGGFIPAAEAARLRVECADALDDGAITLYPYDK